MKKIIYFVLFFCHTFVFAQKQDSVYFKKFSDDGELIIKELVKPNWCGDQYTPCPYQIKLQNQTEQELVWDATDTLSEKIDAIFDFKYDKATQSISILYAKKEDFGLGMRLGIWNKNTIGKWAFKHNILIPIGRSNLYFEGVSMLYFDAVFVKYNSYYNDDKITNSTLPNYSPASKIYRLLPDGSTIVYDVSVNEQYKKNPSTIPPKH